MRRLGGWIAAVVAAGSCAACPARTSARTVRVQGSDTMVPVVMRWADEFMRREPAAQVVVTGGGSAAGITALLQGSVDVCMSSRELTREERALAQERVGGIQEVVVAHDGVTVIVHPSNPVDALSLDQVRNLFNGTLTRWEQGGGEEGGVELYGRESSSGTFLFVNRFVLKGDDFARSARSLPATRTIVEAVRQDRGGIGYVGMNYARTDTVKSLGVHRQGEGPVWPTPEAVGEGTYPLVRPLRVVWRAGASPDVEAFVGFTTSAAGQACVQEVGLIGLARRGGS